MIKGITAAILWYLDRNPGANSTAICHAYPEHRHSVTSALVRLTNNGQIIREKDSVYRYRVAPGVEVPDCVELESVPGGAHKAGRQTAINKAKELEKKGLYYRAATEWQRAWDLTGNMTDRSEITKRIKRCHDKAFHPARTSYSGIAIARYVG